MTVLRVVVFLSLLFMCSSAQAQMTVTGIPLGIKRSMLKVYTHGWQQPIEAQAAKRPMDPMYSGGGPQDYIISDSNSFLGIPGRYQIDLWDSVVRAVSFTAAIPFSENSFARLADELRVVLGTESTTAKNTHVWILDGVRTELTLQNRSLSLATLRQDPH